MKTNSLRPSVFPQAIERKGSILIIALWSICLLAAFVLIVSGGVRQKIILVQRLNERNKLHFIAEAGVERAIFELRKTDPLEPDALSSNWSNNVSMFKAVDIGGGKFDVFYNYIDGTSGTIETRYGLVDEERKININKAEEKVLRRLFQIACGFSEMKSQELAASIVDWRDSDSELSIPIGSAEDSYYISLQYPYEAKDAEFEVLEELLLVRGVDADIFKAVKSYITVYGSGKVNINTASGVTLLALGLDEDIIEKLFLFRRGEDEVSGTFDDNVFEMPSTIIAELSQFCHLSDSEVARLSTVIEQNLITGSANFMIRSRASLTGRRNTTEISCVVTQGGNILYWREI